MRRMKLVGLSIMAVLALSAFAVAPAFAGTETNPGWWVSGTGAVLASGKTVGLSASAVGVQKLKATGVEIDCNKVGVKSGATLLGGIPGGDEETLIYSECTVKGHPEPECVATGGSATNKGEIITEALKSKLAFKTKVAAEKKEASASKSVTVFTPVNAGGVFVEIGLEGSCGFVPTESKVTGSVMVDNIQTNEGSAAKAAENEIVAKNEKEYFTSALTKEAVSLKAFGLAASYEGSSKVKLTTGEEFSVEG
jgi:hypothetical protein